LDYINVISDKRKNMTYIERGRDRNHLV